MTQPSRIFQELFSGELFSGVSQMLLMPESIPRIDNFHSRTGGCQNSKNGNEININLVYIVDFII